VDRGDHYACQCALGFSGENCTVNNDDCISHMCQVWPSKFLNQIS
jgi:slit protein 2